MFYHLLSLVHGTLYLIGSPAFLSNRIPLNSEMVSRGLQAKKTEKGSRCLSIKSSLIVALRDLSQLISLLINQQHAAATIPQKQKQHHSAQLSALSICGFPSYRRGRWHTIVPYCPTGLCCSDGTR